MAWPAQDLGIVCYGNGKTCFCRAKKVWNPCALCGWEPAEHGVSKKHYHCGACFHDVYKQLLASNEPNSGDACNNRTCVTTIDNIRRGQVAWRNRGPLAAQLVLLNAPSAVPGGGARVQELPVGRALDVPPPQAEPQSFPPDQEEQPPPPPPQNGAVASGNRVAVEVVNVGLAVEAGAAPAESSTPLVRIVSLELRVESLQMQLDNLHAMIRAFAGAAPLDCL